MTSKEAKIFKHHSETNSTILNCICSECEPYKDWFTYRRWLAQKQQVNQGEVGTRLTTFLEDEDGNIKTKSGNTFRKVTAVVFCRHQLVN